MKLTSALTAAAALAVSVLPFTVSAQDAPAPSPTPAVDGSGAGTSPAPDANGQRRQRGNPEDFRKRMLDRVKTMLKASDDEFAVIQPLMEKVYMKQREAGASRGFGGPRPQRGGPEGQQGQPNGAPRGGGEPDESKALREALANDNTSPAEIQQKLTALREQRKKAAAELAAAREDLRKVLTARQEATLVQLGLLE